MNYRVKCVGIVFSDADDSGRERMLGCIAESEYEHEEGDGVRAAPEGASGSG